MGKPVKFFIVLIGVALCGLIFPSRVFAESEALSAKMIKLKTTRQGDLILCSTGSFEDVVKEIAKQQGIKGHLMVIKTVVLVEKNSKDSDSLEGNIYEGNFAATNVSIKHQEFQSCKEIVVIEKGRLDEIATIFASMLNGGFPLVVVFNNQSKVTPPVPDTPTTPVSRRSYF